MDSSISLHVLDYVIFFGVLLGSLAIGIYYSFSQKSSSEYLQGKRRMRLVPVSISMIVSFVSAVTMQGVPAEVYAHGLYQYLPGQFSAWGSLLAVWTFVPLYYNLQLVSVYQYLELRFQHRGPTLIACISVIVCKSLFMGIATIGPAQMLQSIIGTPTWLNILIMLSVCTIYTSVGGIKAVVWTDVLQASIMFFGIIAVAVIGATKLTGTVDVWAEMDKRGQFDLNWSLDPFVRTSVWISFLSLTNPNFQIFSDQAAMMRYTALDSMTKAKITVFVGAIGYVILGLLCCAAAVVMYAYYLETGCDPLASGELYSPNQLLPYFVITVLQYPGMSGLFVAAIVSATLSSVSSWQNGLSAITWQDLLSHWLPNISDVRQTAILKVTVVVYGLMSLAFAVFADSVGGTLFLISNAVQSVFLGPTFGIFLLAGMFPFVGPISSMIGCGISILLSLWLSIGGLFNSPIWQTVPESINDACDVINATAAYPSVLEAEMTTFIDYDDNQAAGFDWSTMYSVSPLLYPTIGTVITMVVALLLTIIPSCRQKGTVGGEYLFPFARRYFNVVESDSFLKTKKIRRSQSLEDVDAATTPSSSVTLLKSSP